MNNNNINKITIKSTLKFPEDTTCNKERTVKNIPWLKYYSYEDYVKTLTIVRNAFSIGSVEFSGTIKYLIQLIKIIMQIICFIIM